MDSDKDGLDDRVEESGKGSFKEDLGVMAASFIGGAFLGMISRHTDSSCYEVRDYIPNEGYEMVKHFHSWQSFRVMLPALIAAWGGGAAYLYSREDQTWMKREFVKGYNLTFASMIAGYVTAYFLTGMIR
ncbi:hypothetical protein JXB11_02145 [Candidatus Woesearchaeota archaeon]|nr:hypothetical protein [Candidatus Woesearchaeota archaeon]